MKPRIRRFPAVRPSANLAALAVFVQFGGLFHAKAANQTWDGGAANLNWTSAANWSNDLQPGGAAQNNDVATFNIALGGAGEGGVANPVLIDTTTINIGGITFSTANVGAFQIGTNAGNALFLSGIGAAYGTHAVTISNTAAASQVIAAPLRFTNPSSTNGSFGFVNNAVSAANTLTLSGAIVANSSTTRPTVLVLDGSNSGTNTISGNITSPTFSQNVPVIVKRGAGTWTLSGTNAFSGNSVGDTTGNFGIQVLDGVLSVQSNAALGTNATANNNKVWVGAKSTTYGYNGALVNTMTSVSGGTLELANNIVLDNGVQVNLVNAGTLRSSGSNTLNAGLFINRPNAAAAVVNISTVGSSDVLTIGNAANDLTGGTADTTLNVGGPGTVSLAQASNYAGGWSLNSGTILLGNNASLGSATAASLAFGDSSSATLRLNSFSPTVVGLSTHATPGTPVIENGTSGTSLLTVNNVTNQVFAGSLNDGAAGTLAFTKGGAGALTLTGNHAYTGATIVNGGALRVNGSAATSSVTVNSGATLSGNGTLTGAVTVNGPSRLAPGAGAVGTLTVGSLTLQAGAILDYEFGTSNDKAVVTTAGGLNLNGGGFNLYQEGTLTQFNTVGTYDLIQYNGSLGGDVANLSVLNPDPTRNYAFSADGSNVKLAISASVISEWGNSAGGSWTVPGNWTGAGVPNASGTTAIFGSFLTAPGTVTLGGSKTVATVAFDNTNSYTISPSASESLFLDNTVNSGQAQIIGTNGSHQLTVPVVLTSNTVATIANATDVISLSGNISGSGNLSKGGVGVLALSGSNTFSGNVTVTSGRLDFTAGALGSGSELSLGGGTLRWASGNSEDISSRLVSFLPGDAIFDTNGNSVAFASSVGNSGLGGLVKTGAGSLSLAATNSFSGNTTVSGGTLIVGADTSLGTVPAVATPGSLTLGAGVFSAAGSFTLNANRGVALTSASSSIEVAAASTLTYGGIVAGSGKLNVGGLGILNLSATNSYTGGTVIPTGAVLNLSGNGTPGTGQVAFTGGTLNLNRNTYNQGNLFVDAGQTGTVDGLNDRVGISGLTGSGEITLVSRFGASNSTASAFGFRLFAGNGAFAGTVKLKSGVAATVNTFAAYFNGGGFDGNFSNATIQITENARLAGINNSGGNTMTIGALAGDSTGILAGADYAGTNTYNIGTKNLDTVFPGTVANGSAGAANLIKSGTGSLTLSGTNTYTGTTTVNGGTLAVVNATSLGTSANGTTIAGGDVNAKVSITGGLTLDEAWTLGGRQGTNVDSPAIVSVSGNNVLNGAVTPATGGTTYNLGVTADHLTVAGSFVPAGAVTGERVLQIFGAGNGEWSGSIQNGTAIVSVKCQSSGTWVFSGANTYTGDTTIDNGTFTLKDTGSLAFAPGLNGVSGRVTGGGIAQLNGTFNINLGGAELVDDAQWILVDAQATYGSTFTVTGFTKAGTVWSRTEGANQWAFDQATGILTLNVVPSGYASWASTNGLTTGVNDGPTQDPDNDGIENVLEFVLGGLPLTPNTGILPTLNASGTDFVFTFNRSDESEAEVALAFQHSPDLAAWTAVAIGASSNLPAVSVTENGAAADTITVTVPKGTNTKLFGRLQGTK